MTVDDVQKRLAVIQTLKGDPEAAHAEEDALWLDVLKWIADNGAEPQKSVCELAITSCRIRFSRWYA